MANFDLSPLYRSAIGFDRVLNLLQHREEAQHSFPPYNIEILADNKYRITMAVAGFSRNDIEITSAGDTLTVAGRRPKDDTQRRFMHRGIAQRDFQQRFELAVHVKVASASYDNGMLHIDLVREVPDEQKPKRIEIVAAGTDNALLIDQAS